MTDSKPEMDSEEPVFSFRVEDFYTIGGVGFIAAGTVQAGSVYVAR
jgi:GTPase